MQLSKRSKYIILGVGLIVVITLLCLPQILSATLRTTAEKRLSEIIGEPVKVRTLTIHLFPPSAKFDDVDKLLQVCFL